VQLLSNSRSRRVRPYISAGLLLAAAGCASAPTPQPEVARKLSPTEEAEALEAAKRHPIALTYERPRAAEAALPVAPPPIPPQPAAPPPPPQQQQAAQPPANRDQVIIVGEAAPPASARSYTWPSTDSNYTWTDNGWVGASAPGVYVDTWVGNPAFGWGWRYGYPRPWVYPPAVYAPPVVVVPPRRYWNGHWNGHHPSHWNGRHDRPVHRAPAAAPRREVHRAPPARSYSAPRAAPSAPSRSHTHSAPSRRAVRVR
jgi:hypothetical protein